MLRVSCRFFGALQEIFSRGQGVWNLDFGNSPTTEDLIFNSAPKTSTPPFHVLDLEGNIVNKINEPVVPKETLVKIMETMIRSNTIDNILLEAQRQGRISFYLTALGEEATVVGTAAGLEIRDEAFLQYREAGFLLYRGYKIPQLVAQCMGNVEDVLKGRQMPIHYGSRELNVHMVSSPLATQIPHAAGAGYAFRLENEELSDESKSRVAVVIFGEGAASEGDFHGGVNFAAATGSNTLFVVRNNGYAISTPTRVQYKGDGVLARGIGYGIPSARVDGQDVLAILQAVQQARQIIRTTNQPVLIEALCYRLQHHSSSDDSGMYRSSDEIENFLALSPLDRFEKFLVKQDLWTAEHTGALAKQVREELLQELRRQELLPHWPADVMHDDVYKVKTPDLVKAQKELQAHYERNRGFYGK
ncbi:2-oxoisovalerate dehydrogenase alpha subunit,putative [Trypanosoma brucei gambiense DAL972]|uniref:2-oxoisovalerate dehydrogenase subunit alpha n=2 Tax=Trypanosoma brucei TaxID=5691 RepID=D0A145_TRYB9|nr:2-oxoisovalerate dehydrogenase alpha subunit,putative [Trypanosoma brucei gambiense DAL972]RHW68729.1 2-oxoisovalerate dehydrogenase alpha subunit [Trypanosoma brucei equiperdum]CBH14987.1 2-oxoisovalerate dehydrogenase alpha subunit,putative [Trypanosoma brucei gambiense DAL972]|eukprot:XP_011777253.1 2-oxoisovalerate dehydrogenase alpha subunit,putative [Trypanosoma brucei gambiense DAL972]